MRSSPRSYWTGICLAGGQLDRMITAAETSRHPIYRRAAACLRRRDRLFAGDPDEIRTLLERAITPDDDHTLFELYVHYRFVATIEARFDRPRAFKAIASERQALVPSERRCGRTPRVGPFSRRDGPRRNRDPVPRSSNRLHWVTSGAIPDRD